jgi:hypothetical protein
VFIVFVSVDSRLRLQRHVKLRSFDIRLKPLEAVLKGEDVILFNVGKILDPVCAMKLLENRINKLPASSHLKRKREGNNVTCQDLEQKKKRSETNNQVCFILG